MDTGESIDVLMNRGEHRCKTVLVSFVIHVYTRVLRTSLSLSRSLSLCLSLSLSVSLSLSLSLCLSLSPSVCLSVCLPVSPSLSLPPSPCLRPFRTRSPGCYPNKDKFTLQVALRMAVHRGENTLDRCDSLCSAFERPQDDLEFIWLDL